MKYGFHSIISREMNFALFREIECALLHMLVTVGYQKLNAKKYKT